ncbi:hypothetical protein HY994_03540 [Candidatus Micrarchaeota archaeon]|nr:hypothetical protein [Candidatus Micrarchaeota archaeon]
MPFPEERISRGYRVERGTSSPLPPQERRVRNVFTARTFALEVARAIREQVDDDVKVVGTAKGGYFVHVKLTPDDIEEGGYLTGANLQNASEKTADRFKPFMDAVREKLGLELHTKLFFHLPIKRKGSQYYTTAALGIQFKPIGTRLEPKFDFSPIKRTQRRR